MIKSIETKTIDSQDLYRYLSSAITPRPIAFVSTINNNGNRNLSPFSFFNVFSVTPPILIFSPVNRVRNNTTKHTLDNIKQIKECVIALVSEDMGQQASLASCDFDADVNEFKKAGFTEVESDLISPPRIKESPVNFECKVNEIIELGNKGGSGNLIICEILKIHLAENILDKDNAIDPKKLNIISRLGKNWYAKTTEESLYKITKPISKIGMGIDQLPKTIRNSNILSGSDLAILASAEKIPEKKYFIIRDNKNTSEKHILAKQFLKEQKITEAWQVLL